MEAAGSSDMLGILLHHYKASQPKNHDLKYSCHSLLGSDVM